MGGSNASRLLLQHSYNALEANTGPLPPHMFRGLPFFKSQLQLIPHKPPGDIRELHQVVAVGQVEEVFRAQEECQFV